MDLVDINDVKFGDKPDSEEVIKRKIKNFEKDMTEIWSKIPEVYSVSIKNIEEAMEKCKNSDNS